MNILLTGAFKYTNEQIEKIQKLGFKVEFLQNEKDNIEDYESIDIVVCNQLFLFHDIKKFKNLKHIHLTSAGLDRVPLDYINEKNISLFNARGVYSIPISEWVVGKIIEIYKLTHIYYEQQKEKKWFKHRNKKELFGQNVAVVGFGSIGIEVAKRLNSFGCNIDAIDILKPNNNNYQNFIHINSLNDNIHKYDIIVLTLPLTTETKHLVNDELLSKVKKDVLIINVSRGEIINESELVNFLIENPKSFALLDVFEVEPLPETSELWKLENVLITPHISYVSNNNNDRLFNVIFSNLKSIRRGQK